MLPDKLDAADEALLRSLCQQACPEAQTLEFKAELPERSDRGKAEFLKDVCALANADGGDLVYGIAERDGCADSPVPGPMTLLASRATCSLRW
jgi:hypothetical protein